MHDIVTPADTLRAWRSAREREAALLALPRSRAGVVPTGLGGTLSVCHALGRQRRAVCLLLAAEDAGGRLLTLPLLCEPPAAVNLLVGALHRQLALAGLPADEALRRGGRP
jgi:hypothetical protein